VNPQRALVVDASVVLAFYLPAEPYKAQALSLLSDVAKGTIELIVPTLTRYEVLNALSRAVRGLKGKTLPLAEAKEILKALENLDLREKDVSGLEEEILGFTLEYGCTAYDGDYLALAAKESAPFITGDSQLYQAVRENPLGPLAWRLREIKPFPIFGMTGPFGSSFRRSRKGWRNSPPSSGKPKPKNYRRNSGQGSGPSKRRCMSFPASAKTHRYHAVRTRQEKSIVCHSFKG
jgi:predicted nucleic acid-binding protein